MIGRAPVRSDQSVGRWINDQVVFLVTDIHGGALTLAGTHTHTHRRANMEAGASTEGAKAGDEEQLRRRRMRRRRRKCKRSVG